MLHLQRSRPGAGVLKPFAYQCHQWAHQPSLWCIEGDAICLQWNLCAASVCNLIMHMRIYRRTYVCSYKHLRGKYRTLSFRLAWNFTFAIIIKFYAAKRGKLKGAVILPWLPFPLVNRKCYQSCCCSYTRLHKRRCLTFGLMQGDLSIGLYCASFVALWQT